MKLRRETIVNASADAVWHVLGTKFTDAHLWASSINQSQGLGNNGRICDTEMGEFRENIETFNEQTKQISYSAQGAKMPFFVKNLENSWKVFPLSDGKSIVTMELNVSMSFPFNILMALPMRMQLGGVLKKVHEELKYYVEHKGKAHPRKIAAAKKFRAKAPQAVVG